MWRNISCFSPDEIGVHSQLSDIVRDDLNLLSQIITQRYDMRTSCRCHLQNNERGYKETSRLVSVWGIEKHQTSLAWKRRQSPQKTLASWWQCWAEWREGGKEEDVLSSGSRCPILSLCRCRWTGCTLPRTWNVCQILESLWYNYLIQDITAKIQDNLIRFLNPLASGNLTWITLLQLGRQGYPLG